MRTTFDKYALMIAAGCTLIAGRPLQAQEGAPDSSVYTLTPIAVTVTRTGTTDLQETPLSVSAFTAKRLHDGYLNNLADLADFTPGMEVSANANIAQVTVRGIGSNTTLSGGETSATIQVDGVYMARPSTALLDLMDVERVEILRGPQGTLYGRNATAGTINIVTRQPTNEWSTEGTLVYGSHNETRLEGAMRGPLVADRLLGSFSFQKSDRDGFIRNLNPNASEPIGEVDRLQARVNLRVLAADNLELRLAADYTDIDETPLYYAKPLRATGLGEAQFDDIHTVSVDSDPGYTHEVAGLTGILEYRVDDRWSLRGISAVRKSDMVLSADLDATEIPILRTEPLPEWQDQVSQELQLNYSGTRLRAVGGAYYLQESVDSYFFLKIFPANIGQLQGRAADTNASAIFAEGTYDVTATLSLTAGVRYSRDVKDGLGYGGIYALDAGPDPTPQFESLEHAEFSAVTPKFGISYRPRSGLLVYATATRGYKAGGFNFITTPGENSVFGAESVWAYEIGEKATLAGGRAYLNLAAFHNAYGDLQTLEFLGAGTERVRNATNATIRGVELELFARPAGRLEIAGFLGYLDARYRGSFATLDPISATPIDADGNRLNNAPEWSTSVSGQYTWRFERGDIAAGGEVTWKDRSYFSPSNNPFERQEAFALVHGRVEFATTDGRIEVALRGRNLTDRQYITGAAFFLGPTGRPALGRSWTASLNYRP